MFRTKLCVDKDEKINKIRYHHLIISINCRTRHQTATQKKPTNKSQTNKQTNSHIWKIKQIIAQTLTSTHTYQVHICTSKEKLFYDKDEFLNDVRPMKITELKSIYFEARGNGGRESTWLCSSLSTNTLESRDDHQTQPVHIIEWHSYKRSMPWRVAAAAAAQ